MAGDLSRRAQKILHAVVTEYLTVGDAVGSRTVTRRHDLGLSPATVRNVMADLEEIGLLEQRHTSAGRVPTTTGLRFFIDSLLKVRGLTPREKDEIRERVTAPSPDEVDAARVAAAVGSHAPRRGDPRARSGSAAARADRVPAAARRQADRGAGHHGRPDREPPGDRRRAEVERPGAPPSPIDPTRLERIHNYLNQLLAGMTLDEVRDRVIRELGEDKNKYDEAVSSALRLGHAVFVKQPERSADVVIAGQANLLDERPARAASGIC